MAEFTHSNGCRIVTLHSPIPVKQGFLDAPCWKAPASQCPEGDEVPHGILGVLGQGPPGLYGASGAHGNTVPTGLRDTASS